MTKKLILSTILVLLVFGLHTLEAADIKGQVTLSPKGEPYTKGSILIKPIEEEVFFKSEIDKEGNYAFTDLSPGRHIIKMDLYGLTPVEREIEIKDPEETMVLNLSITLS
ncbi:MAG: amino acid carrier protein, partial [Candidatus Aminicenantes bacterium]|nr:amino acid carrier protein [Candidatus Aminicenantes bacterium]